MIINTQGIECAGVSFTEGFKGKYKLYIDTIRKHKDEVMNYVDFQKLIEKEVGISNSALRVDMPFMYNNGFINDYRQNRIGDIKLNNLVTELGNAFYELIILQDIVKTVDNMYLLGEVKDIEEMIIVLTLIHRLKNDSKEYYLKMLKYVFLYDSINEEEFYLIVTHENEPLVLDNFIKEYRENLFEIELVNSNNAYQYTKRILLQGNLIIEKDKRLHINNKWRKLIEKLILEESEDGK